MLKKVPESSFKKIIKTSLKAAFIAEAVAFAVGYGVWYKLNTDRDFRLYMFKNHNWVLEGYYGLGEKVADQKTRQLDLKVWGNEGKL